MNDRRRFLQVLSASALGMGCSMLGLGCGSDGTAGEGSEESGQSGAAGDAGAAGSDQAGASGNGGSAGDSGAGGSAGDDGNAGDGGSTGESAGSASDGGSAGDDGSGMELPPGIAVGAPSLYTSKEGLHQVAGTTLLVGYDAGGFYALSGLCTHQSCDMSSGSAKGGSIRSDGGINCKCHGSQFSASGAVLKGPATKALPAYAIALGPDGILYVDKKTSVPVTERLVIS